MVRNVVDLDWINSDDSVQITTDVSEELLPDLSMQYPHVQKFEYRMDGSSAEEASRLSMMFT